MRNRFRCAMSHFPNKKESEFVTIQDYVKAMKLQGALQEKDYIKAALILEMKEQDIDGIPASEFFEVLAVRLSDFHKSLFAKTKTTNERDNKSE